MLREFLASARPGSVASCLAIAIVGCVGPDRGTGVASAGPAAGGESGRDDDGAADSGSSGDTSGGASSSSTSAHATGSDSGTSAATTSGPASVECEQWSDPFPPLPAANDPAFPPGKTSHVGPNGVEFELGIPEDVEDTVDLPLVLTADINNGGLRFERVVSLYFPVETGGKNAWIDDEFWNCWPECSVFTFLGVEGTEALLLDLGERLRFAHDRVFMDGVGEGREEVTIGLDPALQPYFAGVVHYYSEWQMAVCPAVATTTPQPCAPKVLFGMAGCDHSYCPSQSCFETVESAGYEVTRLVGADVGSCPCPLTDLNSVPHLLPMPAFVRDAHVQFVLETTK